MHKIEYHHLVEDDLKLLGNSIVIKVLKKIEKIAQNPSIGFHLGNKADLDLVGFRKVYVDNKKIRIVYKVLDEVLTVYVVVVGKRDEMKVYKDALRRK